MTDDCVFDAAMSMAIHSAICAEVWVYQGDEVAATSSGTFLRIAGPEAVLDRARRGTAG